jgi:hypothetical protein
MLFDVQCNILASRMCKKRVKWAFFKFSTVSAIWGVGGPFPLFKWGCVEVGRELLVYLIKKKKKK